MSTDPGAAHNAAPGPGALLGYIRVSTQQQTHDQQRTRLLTAGVHPSQIYAEKVSGAAARRPEFDRLLQDVRPGDVILATSLDRLGRNTAQVVTTFSDLHAQGITVRTLSDGVDTSTLAGKLLATIMAGLAEFERGNTMERTAYARAEARRQGKQTGRPRKLTDPRTVQRARVLLNSGETAATVAATFNVSRATLYRALKATTTTT